MEIFDHKAQGGMHGLLQKELDTGLLESLFLLFERQMQSWIVRPGNTEQRGQEQGIVSQRRVHSSESLLELVLLA